MAALNALFSHANFVCLGANFVQQVWQITYSVEGKKMATVLNLKFETVRVAIFVHAST